MKNVMPLQLAKLLGSVMLLCMTSSLSSAQTDPSDPLKVQMGLVTSRAFPVGEPIILHYEIGNILQSGQVSYHAGYHGDEWYTLSITQKASRPTGAIREGRSSWPTATHTGTDVTVESGRSQDGDIVVSPALVPKHPGNYTLTVRVRLQGNAPPAASSPENEAPDDNAQFRFTEDYVFPLMVTKGDLIRLTATAEELSHDAQSVGNIGRSRLLVESLFSIPEAQALPSWQSLADNPKTPDPALLVATERLGCLRSSAAVRLLGQLAFRHSEEPASNNESVNSSASKALATLYNTSDAGFRQQIEQVFISHGLDKSRLLEIATASPSH
jgi:hypothetical protein